MSADNIDEFILAACVPRRGGHATGTCTEANAILAANPEIGSASIHTAAILGLKSTVRRFLAEEPSNATTMAGPHNWDALTHLCFSRFLRDRSRSDGFVEAATALLDAGANPNTGWFDEDQRGQRCWESVLYGAAGIAHHAALTRLLLARDADPNDGETPYHAPETRDNAALHALVESGKLNADSLATLLLRKADWHDGEGLVYLLEHGADPNRLTVWGHTALHQAVRRDNALENIEALLDHGADPSLPNRPDGQSAISIAVRRGRADVLAALERRGIPLQMSEVERLIAACARDDTASIRDWLSQGPGFADNVVAEGGTLLAEFAGNGNTGGVRQLLDLEVEVDALYGGNGYFEIATDSTALHVAAWLARHDTVRFLLERGAEPGRRDGKGRTPLQLAVRACVHSHWTIRRSGESVTALLGAGASPEEVLFPSSYDEVDALLLSAGARPSV